MVAAIHDLALSDVFLDMFHLYRNYPIIMTYPLARQQGEKRTVPWLWTPDKNKDVLKDSIEQDGMTWEYVATDLINGADCAFFRNADVVGMSPEEAKRYYTQMLSGIVMTSFSGQSAIA